MKRSIKIAAALFACVVITTAPAYAQNTPKLTDPEIASVAVTANKIDINYAKIAMERSKNQEVLQFAKTMTNDHTAVINQAVALVTKLKVTPKDNAVSKKLNADAEKTKKTLRAKSAADFDKAYVDNEVAYHKSVINAIENVLIPQSQNAELKKFLQDVIPAFRTHLEHAEMVQKMFATK